MAGLTQSDRLIRIYTPLGADVLVTRSFEGQEEISRLYEYRVVCASENGEIKPADIVGKRVTLSIVQSDRQTERYFDGFVSHFANVPSRHRLYEYELTIVPWLWFLTRTTNCRIFQDKTVPEVIEKVFKDLGFTDFQLQISGSHQPWVYCVQYRETAFNFVSRLMEKEGIFYFFKHQKGKHIMVLGDKLSVHQPCEYKSVVRMEPATSSGFLRGEDTVSRWERHYEFRSGKWAQSDYNFETPTTSLLTNESTVLRIEGNQKYEFYDYPGDYDTKGNGETLTKLRMEQEESGYDTATGAGNCRFFSSGYKFTLEKHEQASQNIEYTLRSVRHKGEQGSLYSSEDEGEARYENSFECFPASVQFRPELITPKAVVQGTQTAVVVGPSGEEIYTDQYGRVKVQFFWDREGKKDDKSSCWIRVSQPWAGKNWGGIWIPRIGQEVVVDFLEGDPDRPLIVGRVYNEQQTVPYDLPANSTQSGFKSRSSKGGGSADFNELRFEDKKGSEEVFLQAQKDLTIIVENDETRTVGHDRSKTVQHDETTTIGHDRTESVGQNETGTIGKDRQWSIGQNDEMMVGQKQTITVGQEIMVQAGAKITIMAASQIMIQCGASSITLTPASIVVTAGVIKLN